MQFVVTIPVKVRSLWCWIENQSGVIVRLCYYKTVSPSTLSKTFCKENWRFFAALLK